VFFGPETSYDRGAVLQAYPDRLGDGGVVGCSLARDSGVFFGEPLAPITLRERRTRKACFVVGPLEPLSLNESLFASWILGHGRYPCPVVSPEKVVTPPSECGRVYRFCITAFGHGLQDAFWIRAGPGSTVTTTLVGRF